MSLITLTSVDSNNVSFEKDGKQFGALKFEGFFKETVTAITQANSIYDYVRAGFWNDNNLFKQGEEEFLKARFYPLGKMYIEDLKEGKRYRLKGKAFLKEKYDLIDESGEVIFHIHVQRGFLVTIKRGVIETTPLFDSFKNQFLFCAAAVLMIKQKIRRRAAAAA